MAYVRKKKVKDREYYQLVEAYRENGKVRQRVLAHLGRSPNVDDALETLPQSIAMRRRVLSRYPKRLQPGMERRILQDEERLARLTDLRSRGIA